MSPLQSAVVADRFISLLRESILISDLDHSSNSILITAQIALDLSSNSILIAARKWHLDRSLNSILHMSEDILYLAYVRGSIIYSLGIFSAFIRSIFHGHIFSLYFLYLRHLFSLYLYYLPWAPFQPLFALSSTDFSLDFFYLHWHRFSLRFFMPLLKF